MSTKRFGFGVIVFGSGSRLKISLGGEGAAESDVGRPKGRNHGNVAALVDIRRLELIGTRCGSSCGSISFCCNKGSTERGCCLSSYGGGDEN